MSARCLDTTTDENVDTFQPSMIFEGVRQYAMYRNENEIHQPQIEGFFISKSLRPILR